MVTKISASMNELHTQLTFKNIRENEITGQNLP